MPKLTEQERAKLIAEVEAIEIQEPENSRGVVSIKLSTAWAKYKPFVMMFSSIFPKLRPYGEALIAGIDRLIAADAENEEGEI